MLPTSVVAGRSYDSIIRGANDLNWYAVLMCSVSNTIGANILFSTKTLTPHLLPVLIMRNRNSTVIVY